MTRALDDLGYCLAVSKPVRLKVFAPGKLPDAAQMAGCLIVVNDPADGPRLRLALSNGAEWDRLGLVGDAPPAMVPALVDLMPAVRQAVVEALPALVARPQPVALAAPMPPMPHAGDTAALHEANRQMAGAVLEMSEHVNGLLRRVADLEARCEYLEKHAVAAVNIA